MDAKKIQAIRDFIINAEKSIKNAKKILKDILEENWIEVKWDEIDLCCECKERIVRETFELSSRDI